MMLKIPLSIFGPFKDPDSNLDTYVHLIFYTEAKLFIFKKASLTYAAGITGCKQVKNENTTNESLIAHIKG